MNLSDYLKYVITNKLYTKTLWYKILFTFHPEGYKSKYLHVNSDGYYVVIGEELLLLSTDLSRPPLRPSDKLKLEGGVVINFKEGGETTLGLIIANLIKLVEPFGDTIPYINEKFTSGTIEKLIPNLIAKGDITIKQYLKFVDTVSLGLSIGYLFVQPSTIKTITPPPDMAEFKAKLSKEFDKEYGVEWVKDAVLAVKFKDALAAHDDEYLKDDPGYGKILSGKVTNNSRPRLYGVFGVEYGFDKTGTKHTFIKDSLSEGYPKDIKALAALYNAARSGSHDRGAETQKGGSMAKDMLRPTSALRINSDACGTTEGLTVYVTEANHHIYDASYMLKDKRTILIDDTKSLIGKTIVVRSPQYCKEEGDNFCKKCMTKNMGELKDGIPLLIIAAAGIVLDSSMKGMHQATKKTMNFNIFDAIR